MHLSFKEFRIPAEKNRIECKSEISINFIGNHKLNLLLHGLKLFNVADITYAANVLSVNVAGYFPDKLPIILDRITIDDGLEITWV